MRANRKPHNLFDYRLINLYDKEYIQHPHDCSLVTDCRQSIEWIHGASAWLLNHHLPWAERDEEYKPHPDCRSPVVYRGFSGLETSSSAMLSRPIAAVQALGQCQDIEPSIAITRRINTTRIRRSENPRPLPILPARQSAFTVVYASSGEEVCTLTVSTPLPMISTRQHELVVCVCW